jgi:micrococcal nuclease
VRIILAALLLSAGTAVAACKAVDGDTVRCGKERIRLKGVYAPERHETGGAAAKRSLQRRLDSGQVYVHRYGKDHYGRTVGDVYVNGRRVTQSDVGSRGGRGSQTNSNRRKQK